MRVTSQDVSGLGAAGAGQTQEAQKSASAGGIARSSASGGSDHVDFSSALGSLARAMNAEGSSHEAKVQALAAQYQSGGYRADAAGISRGLVSEAFGQ